MWPPITITITITGGIWPDYYYYYYSGIMRSLLLLLLLSPQKCFITVTITITISNSLTALVTNNLIVDTKWVDKIIGRGIMIWERIWKIRWDIMLAIWHWNGKLKKTNKPRVKLDCKFAHSPLEVWRENMDLHIYGYYLRKVNSYELLTTYTWLELCLELNCIMNVSESTKLFSLFKLIVINRWCSYSGWGWVYKTGRPN